MAVKSSAKMDTPSIRDVYAKVYPTLRRDLKDYLISLKSPSDVIERFEQSLEANTQSGRQSRALMVPYTADALLGETLHHDQIKELCILACLVQLQTSYILVADDIVDRSTTRRGKPTWWCRPQIGVTAVSDAFILNFCIYYLLKRYFEFHPTYLDLVHLFQENSFLTEIGQSGDHLIASKGPSKFDGFTMDNYDFIITHKGGHFLSMGVIVALLYLQLGTPANISQVRDITMAFGKYAQVQDDFLDAFADPAVTGKIGTDIQENKCTWLIIQALQRCTPEQRRVLEMGYGTEDEEMIAKVKVIYAELHLDQVYYEYEKGAMSQLKGMIDQVNEQEGLKRTVFQMLPVKNQGYGTERTTVQAN